MTGRSGTPRPTSGGRAGAVAGVAGWRRARRRVQQRVERPSEPSVLTTFIVFWSIGTIWSVSVALAGHGQPVAGEVPQAAGAVGGDEAAVAAEIDRIAAIAVVGPAARSGRRGRATTSPAGRRDRAPWPGPCRRPRAGLGRRRLAGRVACRPRRWRSPALAASHRCRRRRRGRCRAGRSRPSAISAAAAAGRPNRLHRSAPSCRSEEARA